MVKNYEKQIQTSINKYEKLASSEKRAIELHQKNYQEYQTELKKWKDIHEKFVRLQKEIDGLSPLNKAIKEAESDYENNY